MSAYHRRDAVQVHLLDTQYRMHPEISRFPNSYFYHNQIADGDKVCGPSQLGGWFLG